MPFQNPVPTCIAYGVLGALCTPASVPNNSLYHSPHQAKLIKDVESSRLAASKKGSPDLPPARPCLDTTHIPLHRPNPSRRPAIPNRPRDVKALEAHSCLVKQGELRGSPSEGCLSGNSGIFCLSHGSAERFNGILSTHLHPVGISQASHAGCAPPPILPLASITQQQSNAAIAMPNHASNTIHLLSPLGLDTQPNTNPLSSQYPGAFTCPPCTQLNTVMVVV